MDGQDQTAQSPTVVMALAGTDGGGTDSYLVGENLVNTLENIPVTKQSVRAIVTTASTLSLAGSMQSGRELHIKAYNNTGVDIIQPLPTTGLWESKNPLGVDITAVVIPAMGSVEISIWYLGGKYIIRTNNTPQTWISLSPSEIRLKSSGAANSVQIIASENYAIE